MTEVIEPKKFGGPIIKFWESLETISLLDSSVIPWLLRHAKKSITNDPPCGRSLSALIIQVLEFVDEHLGSEARDPPCARPPLRFFLDFRSGGSLCYMLGAMFKLKAEAGWRKFEFSSLGRKDANLAMIGKMRDVLVQEGFFKVPVLYLRQKLSKENKELVVSICENRGFTITKEETESTHVLYPPVNADPEDYCRPTLKRGDKCIIHFHCLPDSRDNFGPIPPSEGQESLEMSLERDSIYHVTLSWLTDSDKYNEYMSEEDYKVDEEGNLISHPLSLSYEEYINSEEKHRKKSKRKRSPSPISSSKKKSQKVGSIKSYKRGRFSNENMEEVRLSKEKEEQVQENENLLEGKMASQVMPNESERASREVESYHDIDDLEDDTNSNSMILNRDSLFKSEESEDNVTEQTHHIIVPSYSSWFDYNSIHSIEKRALPEFFNAKNKSKIPEIFLSYRNFMIDTYRLNPTEYLTSTACRRNLAGDVCSIMRVHAFLEQWGLINYQVDIDSKPTLMGPPTTSHFHILADTPVGLQPINSSMTAQPSAARTMINLEEKKEKIIKNEIGTEFGLKTDLFDRKNPNSINRSTPSRDWNDQETLLLLEALEMYKDDWNKICEHVESRSQHECILHFLRLPIEDSYIESPKLGGDAMGPLCYQPFPFSDTGNPIMSTLAFLSSVVDPRVASAGAKAAMEEFARIKDEVPGVIMHTHLKNVQEAQSKGSDTPQTESLERLGIAGTKFETHPQSEDINSKTNHSELEEESDKNPPIFDRSTKEQVQNSEMKSKKTCEIEKSISSSNSKVDDHLIKDVELQSASSAALSSAAVKAKHLASVEERKIKSLVALLVETQMKKLEIKLRHFEELETIMDSERETLEYQRQLLIQERQEFHLEQLHAAELRARNTKSANKDGSESTLRNESSDFSPSYDTDVI
ncbi:SWI/SNF complex subunit SMARCC2 [Lepeophtheirus salmonis]|uniref:SWI/SNF complex subunit SMARCC2 n=1 Tax=Lepeophtheirus salmonis TaxID=72036 RepID=UPI001AE550AD|nr:SWI/SNF complex subunit SMARCC2-like [Lepeophtheirus salmonis]